MRVGVCVPVRGDAPGLRETLASIRADAPDAFVVVGVDGPDAAVEATGHAGGADRVVVLLQPAGSYAARNAAVDALPPDVDLVLFTDAGCRVATGWATAHTAALREAPLSGGAVARVRRDRPSAAEYVDSIRNLDQQTYVEKDRFAATCNLAVRRDVLESVRFDGNLQSGGDREFCHRAAGAGFSLVYTPAAVVEHDCRRTTSEVLTKARRVGAGVAALPPASRPLHLPAASFRRGLGVARRARTEITDRGPVWAAQVAAVDSLRTVAAARAATGAGFRPGPPAPAAAVDVVVLLGTRWSELEHHSTRWRQVVEQWLDSPLVASVTLVDFPRFRRGAVLDRATTLVREAPSWRAGVRVLDATVAAVDRPDTKLFGAWAWGRTGRALRRALGPGRDRRIAVAATPLWAPILDRLDATWMGFDAVDDWRAYGGQAHRIGHIEAGYRWVARHPAVTVTAVSDRLVETLGRDYGLRGASVPNGVDRARFGAAGAAAAPPPGNPTGGYAVYVGVVEGRVDIDLLVETAAMAGPGRVVVAGPVADPVRARLDSSGVSCLGRVDPDDVPALLRGASVALLPHCVGPQTDSMDPMKLLEYLAAGLPVVSTDVRLPADLDLGEVRVRATPERFAATVRELLERPVPRHDGAAVAHRTWAATATTLLGHLTGAAAPVALSAEVPR